MDNFYEIVRHNLSRFLREALEHLGYSHEGDKAVEIVESMSRGVEPEGTYLVYHISSLEDLGSSERSSVILADGKTYYKQSMRMNLHLSSFGKQSGKLLSEVYGKLPSSEELREKLHAWGLSILKKGKFNRNPQMRGTEWVESYNTTYEVTLIFYYSEDSNWIESVSVNGYSFKVAND